MINKRDTVKKIRVGGVEIGGGAPVTVQTMCSTKTWDVESTVSQIKAMEAAGIKTVSTGVGDRYVLEEMRAEILARIEAAVRGGDR